MAKRYKHFKKIMKFSGSHKGWPIVTCVLIVVCVMVFIIQALVPAGVWAEYALVPANALSRPWTFVSYIFLHSSFDHLMFNLIFFAFWGYYAEIAVGKKGLLAAFLLAGILGGIGGMLIAYPLSMLVGASAAILGVSGFLAAIHPDYPVRLFLPFYRPAISAVVFYWVFDFVYLLTSTHPTAYGAHLVGLAAGILLGIFWKRSSAKK